MPVSFWILCHEPPRTIHAEQLGRAVATMTRSLAISKRQAQTLLRAAEAERAIVEVKVGDVVYRLIPAVHAQAMSPLDDDKVLVF